jgi:hypothetical protein
VPVFHLSSSSLFKAYLPFLWKSQPRHYNKKAGAGGADPVNPSELRYLHPPVPCLARPPPPPSCPAPVASQPTPASGRSPKLSPPMPQVLPKLQTLCRSKLMMEHPRPWIPRGGRARSRLQRRTGGALALAEEHRRLQIPVPPLLPEPPAEGAMAKHAPLPFPSFPFLSFPF